MFPIFKNGIQNRSFVHFGYADEVLALYSFVFHSRARVKVVIVAIFDFFLVFSALWLVLDCVQGIFEIFPGWGYGISYIRVCVWSRGYFF